MADLAALKASISSRRETWPISGFQGWPVAPIRLLFAGEVDGSLTLNLEGTSTCTWAACQSGHLSTIWAAGLQLLQGRASN